jgi:hypothetical protein
VSVAIEEVFLAMKIHEINAKNKKNYYSSKWVIYQVIRGSNPLIPTLYFE